MPEETIKAFQDHGEVRGDTVLDGKLDEARMYLLEQLAAVGIDYDDVVATCSSGRACRSSPTRSRSCWTA